MAAQNPLIALRNAGKNTEIWWDTSPLLYEEWQKTCGENMPELFHLRQEKEKKSFDSDSLLQGSTTNPPLAWQALEKNPEFWRQWLLSRSTTMADSKEAMWQLYLELARAGATMLLPIFSASNRKRGQICCQVDPRDMTDIDAMMSQAQQIHLVAPNVMVKIPGTREGIECVRLLTGLGIPTNVTLGFTVSQLMAVGEAALAGLQEANKSRGTDLTNWRSCAVMMLGRYEDALPMKEQATQKGIELSEEDIRWAGIAIFRKAHRIFLERKYPSKLMAASMRLGPEVAGEKRVWHLEKLAGSDAVLTVFPNIFEQFVKSYRGLDLPVSINEQIPEQVLNKLLQIPYFVQAFEEQGISQEQFVEHPALQATAASFCEAMDSMETFVRESLS